MEKKRQVFDILRICAALMVFTVHFFMFVEAPQAISRITANFSSGVALFFVMSGFLMMQSLERSSSYGEYLKKRVVRIIPAYYAMVIVAMLVWDLWLGQTPADELGLGWLRYFLFLNTIVPSKHYYFWNDLWGLWTFSCFMVFYLLAPFIKKWIRNYRQALLFLAITIVAGYAIGYGIEYWFYSLGYEDSYIIAGDSPWFNLNIFAIGVALWHAVREKKENHYIGVCAFLVLAIMLMEKDNRISYGCLAAILVLAFWNLEIKNRLAGKIIEIMSRYSFSLYLVHLGVMDMLNLARKNGLILNNIVFAILCVAGSAAGAVLLYHLVEHPAARLISGKKGKK